MPTDVVQFLGYVGSIGVFTALLTHGLGWFTEWRKSHALARHLALQLAVAFEAFADECGNEAGDNITARDSHGHAGRRGKRIPDPPELPDDVEAWRVLEASLRNRCMTFQHDVRFARGLISFNHDVDPDFDDSFDDGLEQQLRLGSQANALAIDLRDRYRWQRPTGLAASRDWMATEFKTFQDRRAHDAAFQQSLMTGVPMSQPSTEPQTEPQPKR